MIKIEWMEDEHDCETCGWAKAEGAKVHIMRQAQWEHVFTLTPVASCFGGDSWDRAAVYRGILEALGHEIVEA